MPPEKSSGLATSMRVLAGEVGAAGGRERVQRVLAGRRVDQYLAVDGGVGEATRRRGPSELPLCGGEVGGRRDDAPVAAVFRLRGVPRADHHAVTELEQLGGERLRHLA